MTITKTLETASSMPGLIVHCPEKLAEVCEFAEKVNAQEHFLSRLKYLSTYGQCDGRMTRCNLYPDSAPHSFLFKVEAQGIDFSWERFMFGGLIYDGPGCPNDGSAPAFTVSLTRSKELHSWGIHT